MSGPKSQASAGPVDANPARPERRAGAERKGGRTMLDGERPAVMTVAVARAIRARVCVNKRRFGRRDARVLAATCNVAREPGSRPYNAYPCPFSDGARHWHVSHVITVADMAALGQAIRALRQAA